MGKHMQMIDLEEPMSKKELRQLEELLGLEYKKINTHVHISYDNEVVQIVNNKGGEASVFLKLSTFEKVAKELGYSLKRSSKSG